MMEAQVFHSEVSMTADFIERRAVCRTANYRLLRIQEVARMCGFSRSSVYAAMRDGTFPLPIAIGVRARAWISYEVQDWINQRIRTHRTQA